MAELENVIQNIIDDSFETDDVNTLLMASALDIENIIINKGEEPDYIIEKALEYATENISDCKKILNNIKPMHIKQVDKNNIFIQSKDKNYPKEVKKILSEANIDFIITKESNLMYYFND